MSTALMTQSPRTVDRMTTRLLIGEPDPVLREMYRLYFSHSGFDVETAADGVECLSQLNLRTPDVMVLDVELRWGGTQGLLAHLLVEDRLPPIPVILTGAGGRDIPNELLGPPVVSYFLKPLHLAELRDRLRTIVAALEVVAGVA